MPVLLCPPWDQRGGLPGRDCDSRTAVPCAIPGSEQCPPARTSWGGRVRGTWWPPQPPNPGFTQALPPSGCGTSGGDSTSLLHFLSSPEVRLYLSGLGVQGNEMMQGEHPMGSKLGSLGGSGSEVLGLSDPWAHLRPHPCVGPTLRATLLPEPQASPGPLVPWSRSPLLPSPQPSTRCLQSLSVFLDALGGPAWALDPHVPTAVPA